MTLGLHNIDLNLLVALQTLLDEGNVTRAAQKLGITQPAMSRTLGRLRQLFDDPLFVRTPQGLAPTPRATQLQLRLSGMLADIAELVATPEFTPATARNTWQIATTDYGSNSMLPIVMDRLHREAPGVGLEIVNWRGSMDELERGHTQLALCSVNDAPAGIHGRGLGKDNYVALLRHGHPLAGQTLDIDTFVQLPHILIDVGGDPRGPLDLALEKIGKTRRVAVRVPHFMAALGIAARTDMVVTVPRVLARLYAQSTGLIETPLPIPLPEFSYSLLWHERHHHDPAHTWLRTLFYEAITETCKIINP